MDSDTPETDVSVTAADVREMLKARYSAVAPGNGPRYVLGFEVRNQAGFGGYWSPDKDPLRACDLIVMDTWQSGPVRLIGHEVKVSRSDWLTELKDPDKAMAFIPHVAEWWLVVADRSIVKPGELPEGWGLMAPAGRKLRAVTKATCGEQHPIPVGLTAGLLRAVERGNRAELAEAKKPRPHTPSSVPYCMVADDVPRNGWMLTKPSEIQEPLHDLRRRRR